MKREAIKAAGLLNRILFRKFFKLNYFVTYRCNSRCRICNIWKGCNKTGEKELGIQEIRSLFQSLRGRIFWINLTGGEPFLRDDISEIVTEAIRIVNPLILNIPTNGLLPGKVRDFVDGLKRNGKWTGGTKIIMSVSVDELGEKDDELRGVRGAFEKALETHRILSSSGLVLVYFQVNISGYNISDIERILDSIPEYGRYVITFAHRADLYRNDESRMTADFHRDEIIRFIDNFLKTLKTRDLHSAVTKLYFKGMRDFLLNGKAPVRCAALRSTMTIDPYGNLLPCPYKTGAAGNIRNYDMDPFRLVLTEEKISDIRSQNENCNMCWQNCEAIPSLMNEPFYTLKCVL